MCLDPLKRLIGLADMEHCDKTATNFPADLNTRSLIMDDKIYIAIAAALFVMIGGVIKIILKPYLIHKIERDKDRQLARKSQILQWRAMILELHQHAQTDANIHDLISTHPEFLKLEPLLLKAEKQELQQKRRTIVVDQPLAPQLEIIKIAVSRIETQWELNK